MDLNIRDLQNFWKASQNHCRSFAFVRNANVWGEIKAFWLLRESFIRVREYNGHYAFIIFVSNFSTFVIGLVLKNGTTWEKWVGISKQTQRLGYRDISRKWWNTNCEVPSLRGWTHIRKVLDTNYISTYWRSWHKMRPLVGLCRD